MTVDNKTNNMLKSFKKGIFSDVTIRAFDKEYKLNKCHLSVSCEFFEREFAKDNQNLGICSRSIEKGKSSDNYVELDDIDDVPFITQKSFELMLCRIYGSPDVYTEDKMLVSMLSSAISFGYQDLLVSVTKRLTERIMNINDVTDVLEVMQGAQVPHELKTKLTNSVKAYVHQYGFNKGSKPWREVPDETIITLIKDEESLFNFEKAMFVLQVMKRKAKKNKKSSIFDDSFVPYLEEIYQGLEEEEKMKLECYREKAGKWSSKPKLSKKIKNLFKKKFRLRTILNKVGSGISIFVVFLLLSCTLFTVGIGLFSLFSLFISCEGIAYLLASSCLVSLLFLLDLPSRNFMKPWPYY